MACTSRPLSAESRRPLHTQVTQLREERVALLEAQRALREEKATLTQGLAKASEKIAELQAQLYEGEAARGAAEEVRDAKAQALAMQEAVAQQLRAEAAQWQARVNQGEMDRARAAADSEAERRRTTEAAESERLRLLAEAATAVAEKKAAEEHARQMIGEGEATRRLLEAQRDDALSRANRAEESLAVALSEQRALSEALARVTEQAGTERAVLEQKVDGAEKRWAEAARRCEELAQQRLRLEQHRAKADETAAIATHEKRHLEAQLSDEWLLAQGSAKREGALRHQLEAAEWALSSSAHHAASVEVERAALAERGASLASSFERAHLSQLAALRVQSGATDGATAAAAAAAAATPGVRPAASFGVGGGGGPAAAHAMASVLSPSAHSPLSAQAARDVYLARATEAYIKHHDAALSAAKAAAAASPHRPGSSPLVIPSESPLPHHLSRISATSMLPASPLASRPFAAALSGSAPPSPSPYPSLAPSALAAASAPISAAAADALAAAAGVASAARLGTGFCYGAPPLLALPTTPSPYATAPVASPPRSHALSSAAPTINPPATPPPPPPLAGSAGALSSGLGVGSALHHPWTGAVMQPSLRPTF